MFRQATRSQSKLRLCLTGISGSGKTLGALTIANELKGNHKIAFIDTENGSAELYSDKFEFDVLNMEPPYSPDKFVDAIKFAESENYSVIVIDSATHEWAGEGGCLEDNEKLANARYKGNTWAAWNETTPKHMRFISAMVQSKCHIICTARNKKETTQVNNGGKVKVVHSGIKLVQREGFEYEFTICLEVNHEGHYVNSLKDRTGLFENVVDPITKETGESILEWLNDGRSQSSIVDSYINEINECQTIENLKSVYSAAYKAVSRFSNQELTDKINKAKDLKKSSLSPENENKAASQAMKYAGDIEKLAMSGDMLSVAQKLDQIKPDKQLNNEVFNLLSDNCKQEISNSIGVAA